MKVEVTLGGAFTQYMPEGRNGNRFIFDAGASAAAGTSVLTEATHDVPINLAELLDNLGVEPDQPLLAILNGSVIPVDAFTTTQLADDDQLALMPPITAG